MCKAGREYEESSSLKLGALEEEVEAYKRWDLVSGLEESFLKQRSKLHWLKKGWRLRIFREFLQNDPTEYEVITVDRLEGILSKKCFPAHQALRNY